MPTKKLPRTRWLAVSCSCWLLVCYHVHLFHFPPPSAWKNKTGALEHSSLCLVFTTVACSVEAWCNIITTILAGSWNFTFSVLDRPAAVFRQNGFLIHWAQFYICPRKRDNSILSPVLYMLNSIFLHGLIRSVSLQFHGFKIYSYNSWWRKSQIRMRFWRYIRCLRYTIAW